MDKLEFEKLLRSKGYTIYPHNKTVIVESADKQLSEYEAIKSLAKENDYNAKFGLIFRKPVEAPKTDLNNSDDKIIIEEEKIKSRANNGATDTSANDTKVENINDTPTQMSLFDLI